ncbi:MAG TPA: AMP-binding protein [Streptosporangiaceae bacterium]|nr:AMP-binding protein [Streptosporangiaceae bacterium]
MTSTVPAAVDAAARDFGDAIALAEPGGLALTYAQLRARVRAVAGALIASGVKAGDRVAIWAPNTSHWVLAALGSLYAGTTLVPVNTRYTGHEAVDVITRAQVRVLFVTGPFLGADRLAMLSAAADEAGAVLPGLTVSIAADGHSGDGHSGDGNPGDENPGKANPGKANPGRANPGRANPGSGNPGGGNPGGGLAWDEFLRRSASPDQIDRRASAITPDDISDILFTSGTTGRSKGAMSAHRQALDVASAWAGCGGLSSADRYLIINPFFHSFGYKAGILACLLTGAAMVPHPAFDPGVVMRLIPAERITVLPGAPTLYVSLLGHPDRGQHDLSSLRLAVTGAAVVPVALVERMRAELSFDTVLTAYGLTEAVVATMCRPEDDDKTIATTSGRAAAGFEIKIAGTAGEAKPGEAGEILLRGPNVMLGYLDDPQATSEAIDAGGWLHTGDVGHLDEHGYLTITDRLKDMYICGGFNVYPAEVEQVLARHPAVAESAVIGTPDERLGEVGKAFVVPSPGAEPAADELIAFCRDRLAGFKVPRQFEFLAALPRNASGKPLKRVLREES